MAKKRKLSELNGTELVVAYETLKTIREFIQPDEEVEDAATTDSKRLDVRLDRVLDLMASRIKGREVCTAEQNHPSFSLVQASNFSSMTESLLEDRLGVTFGGIITLKADVGARAQMMAGLGEDHLWSSKNLYNHLMLLKHLIPRTVCGQLTSLQHFLCFFTHSLGQAPVRG
jgi:hypothetical protein